ncbi:uncharacterized protein EAF02_007704 [Botrytis sinoallii]|uniref:uncharacterized protein n=1 Tax=Botrytis sinoallii TaxID=1463999 RepID=UPI0018FF23E1|nr:uncharacterized protein EAF02_007704 [Botrytis sinoallii]KAF7880067.1 hypothetical protein EAF02_007704 [Botrytis sinoallii]
MTAGLKTIISLSFSLISPLGPRSRIPPRNPLLRALPPIPSPPCRSHIHYRSLPNFSHPAVLLPMTFPILPLLEFSISVVSQRVSSLPAVLAHSHIITVPAMVMSIIGGVLIYGTVISFGMFFQEEAEF